MKKQNLLTLMVGLFFGLTTVMSQNSDNPWQITLGVNAVDFYPVGGHTSVQGGNLEGITDVGHWNTLPSISYLGVSKNISGNWSLGLAGSMNSITQWGAAEIKSAQYYSADLNIKYSLGSLIKSKKLEPFVGFGGSWVGVEQNDYFKVDGDNIGQPAANALGGLSVWFSDGFGLTLQSQYKHSFGERKSAQHFQHTLGVALRFGGKDSDGDGVYDKNDDCPEVPGLAAFNGCPDTDGDGIQDSKDDCPNVAGSAQMNGCPDSDGDGIADSKDSCPNEAGTAAMKGCPDADNDKVADKDDKCPNEAGPAANKGCPWPDSDNDGVLDKDDNCPNEAGTAANNGCPEVSVPNEVVNQLTNYARTINFNTGKATFKADALPVLKAISAIIKEYPNASFVIEGHTDSTGSNALNQQLSEKRANAVKDYLVENGVNASRLTTVGYSETRPISDNATAKGRSENRRVEVKLQD